MRVKCQKRPGWCRSASSEMGAAMALTSSTATADGNSRRAGEPGLPKAERPPSTPSWR